MRRPEIEVEINHGDPWPPERERAEQAIILFERLCTPLNIFPDSPELATPEHDALIGVWSQILNSMGQAESGGTRYHNWEGTERLALAATAVLIKDLPLSDEKVVEFIEAVGSSPSDYLEVYLSE